MKETKDLLMSNPQKVEHTWTPDQALEAWKHFASVGGADKNTMVTVASWLLGFSGTILGYVVTNLLKSDSFVLLQPVPTFFLGGLGILTSVAAGLVALLYGGYANWNWARADEIAEARGWHDLLPDGPKREGRHNPTGLAALAKKLAGPKDCAKPLAPVFLVFMLLAAISGMVHLAFFIWSFRLIL